MKKLALLLTALLSISAVVVADTSSVTPVVHGTLKTGIEVIDNENFNSPIIKWIVADGFLKPSTSNGWGLGYFISKEHGNDFDHKGGRAIEFKPSYSVGTKWGAWGATTILTQEGDADAFKQELWMNRKVGEGKTLFAKVLPGKVFQSGDRDITFLETEVMLNQSIAGGNLGTGVFYKPFDKGIKNDGSTDHEVSEVVLKANYGKSINEKVFALGYTEYTMGKNDTNDDKWTYFKVGAFGNYKLTSNLLVECETNIRKALDDSVGSNEKFFMTALRYNF